MAENPRLDVDIVIPVFNEAGLIERIHGHLCDVLGSIPHNFRIIYVDDGSSDGTADTLRRIADADRRISLLQLSRNFGHQAALTAGMDAAAGVGRIAVVKNRANPLQ